MCGWDAAVKAPKLSPPPAAAATSSEPWVGFIIDPRFWPFSQNVVCGTGETWSCAGAARLQKLPGCLRKAAGWRCERLAHRRDATRAFLKHSSSFLRACFRPVPSEVLIQVASWRMRENEKAPSRRLRLWRSDYTAWGPRSNVALSPLKVFQGGISFQVFLYGSSFTSN